MPRFMMIVVPGHGEDSQKMPGEAEMAAMLKYNEEMVKAGVMLSGEGLLPSKMGARVHFTGKGTSRVQDGPFTESKELIGGFWIIQVKSKEEALEWARKVPFEDGVIEVRRIGEIDDYGVPEIAEKEKKLFAELERQNKERAQQQQ